MISAYASQPNYWRHLAPIVDELRERGHHVETWSSRAGHPWGSKITMEALTARVMLVASYVDAVKWPRSRVCYVEHGAGQTYVGGRQECYAGSPGLDHVVLFLGPGEHVAARWRDRYPQAAVESVGCPALDQHLRIDPLARAVHRRFVQPPHLAPLRSVVAISSHWDCGVVPETRPAIFEFERGIRDLARLRDEGSYYLIGHGHPRSSARTRQLFERVGIRFEVDPDVVLRTADLLVHDNSSLMYEAAALDIPVLALNAKRYRRNVEHGLRFWSHVPGYECDDSDTLVSMVDFALDDPAEARRLRARAATHVYAHRDGQSARRAAEAIERVL